MRKIALLATFLVIAGLTPSTALAQQKLVQYKVLLYSADKDEAGTGGRIFVTLHGVFGDSGEMWFGKSMRRNWWVDNVITGKDVGVVTALEVRNSSSDGWWFKQAIVEWPDHRCDPEGTPNRLRNCAGFVVPGEGIYLDTELGDLKAKTTVPRSDPLAPAALVPGTEQLKYVNHEFKVVRNEDPKTPSEETISFSTAVSQGVTLEKKVTKETGTQRGVSATYSYTPPQATGGAGGSITGTYSQHVTDTVQNNFGTTISKRLTSTDSRTIHVPGGETVTAIHVFIQSVQPYTVNFAGHSSALTYAKPVNSLEATVPGALSAAEVKAKVLEMLREAGVAGM